ncbi:MAG: hypothetical protein HC888_15220 [Candidatus Competibacteraceae bacterium]|nr:hypothetical protein [Candidatus Competibacteraceae bacterium]
MKSLSAEAIAAIATQYGSKPANIVSVQWGNQYVDYADRQIFDVPGRILNIGEIDSVINVSGGTDSQSVQVTLSDHKGT